MMFRVTELKGSILIFRLLSFYLTLYRDSKMAAAAILNILVVINWLTELLKIMVVGGGG